MSMKLSQPKLKVFGIIAGLGVLLYFLHRKHPILQDIHPVVFGFVFVVVACIFLNFLGQKQFGSAKRKKFDLSEQLPGLLIASVVLLIVIGFAAKSKVILVDIFPSNGQNFILDNIPSNLDIHISGSETLARIPYQQGWLLDRLYPSFKEIQSILSR